LQGDHASGRGVPRRMRTVPGVSGHLPSVRSRVLWRRSVMANGIRTTGVIAPWSPRPSRHGTSQQIRSGFSDSIQLYSLYLTYVYICNTLRPNASTRIAAIITYGKAVLMCVASLCVKNKGKLANKTRRDEQEMKRMDMRTPGARTKANGTRCV
jgi:hypothetical protein